MTWLRKIRTFRKNEKKRKVHPVRPTHQFDWNGSWKVVFPDVSPCQSCWGKKWIKVWRSCRLHPLHFLPDWPWFLIWLRCRSETIPSIISTWCIRAWRPSFPSQLSRAARENRHLLESWTRPCLRDCLPSVCCKVASVKGNYNFHFKVPWESGGVRYNSGGFFPFLFVFNEHWMTIAVRSR